MSTLKETLTKAFGSQDLLHSLRCGELPEGADKSIAAWREVNSYVESWLFAHNYEKDTAEIEDDCIGYACTHLGEGYAVYAFTCGEKHGTDFDPAVLKYLRDLPLSDGRSVIVLYLRVEEETENAEAAYRIGRYNDVNAAPEPWLLRDVCGKYAPVYFPRKELLISHDRFAAAFNRQDLNVLEYLLADNVVFESFDPAYADPDKSVFEKLAELYRQKGELVGAFIRWDDIVYSSVCCFPGYAWIGMSMNRQNRIDRISIRSVDEPCEEFLVTGEVQAQDDTPRIASVSYPYECLSIRLVFDNGEIRQYDFLPDTQAHRSGENDGSVVSMDEMRQGRVEESIRKPRAPWSKAYPPRGQGIQFGETWAVSAEELYRASYPIECFDYSRLDNVCLHQYGYDDTGLAVGYVRELDPQNPYYLLNRNTMTAKLIPQEYQDSPVFIDPFCGGCSEGLLMVSPLGDLSRNLRYHHNMRVCAGLWGWLDGDFNVVIEPKYIYALNFVDGRAIVCKGEWDVKEDGYWCEDECWGVIDRNEREIVPCLFDELSEIDGTDRLYLIHEGGWGGGSYGVFDVGKRRVILKLDFDFDSGYMFNECFVSEEGYLVFDEHLPGEEKDLLYVYDLAGGKWLAHGSEYTERTYEGQSKVVVKTEDGDEITVF